MTPRRRFMSTALLLGMMPWTGVLSASPLIEVWKDPACGCCQEWIKHMQSSGFSVTIHHGGNIDARARLGLPAKYGSCHTARVAGYVLEGHVPARDVHRLLRDKPKGLGLAVPGMPIGSPGMDGPEYKGRTDAYQVLLVSADGSASTYGSYR